LDFSSSLLANKTLDSSSVCCIRIKANLRHLPSDHHCINYIASVRRPGLQQRRRVSVSFQSPFCLTANFESKEDTERICGFTFFNYSWSPWGWMATIIHQSSPGVVSNEVVDSVHHYGIPVRVYQYY
jgi:hypothetical protein